MRMRYAARGSEGTCRLPAFRPHTRQSRGAHLLETPFKAPVSRRGRGRLVGHRGGKAVRGGGGGSHAAPSPESVGAPSSLHFSPAPFGVPILLKSKPGSPGMMGPGSGVNLRPTRGGGGRETAAGSPLVCRQISMGPAQSHDLREPSRIGTGEWCQTTAVMAPCPFQRTGRDPAALRLLKEPRSFFHKSH